MMIDPYPDDSVRIESTLVHTHRGNGPSESPGADRIVKGRAFGSSVQANGRDGQ